MTRRRKVLGFTLIELLVVLAIIGTISAIAIPALLGQRKKARRIGDAQSNGRVIAMAMENRKSENGTYGVAAATATWDKTGLTAGTNLIPTFQPQGNTHMKFVLLVGATGLTYNLKVTEGGDPVYETDQTGKQIYPVP